MRYDAEAGAYHGPRCTGMQKTPLGIARFRGNRGVEARLLERGATEDD